MRKEVVVLEHHAHFEHQRAQLPVLLVDGPAVRAGGDERLAADTDFAAVHGFQIVHAAQQSGLARAAAADNRDDLAAGDAHGHALEDAGFAE